MLLIIAANYRALWLDVLSFLYIHSMVSSSSSLARGIAMWQNRGCCYPGKMIELIQAKYYIEIR